jgi:hypothetical protein
MGLVGPSAVLSEGAEGSEKRLELVVGENWSVAVDDPDRRGCGCGYDITFSVCKEVPSMIDTPQPRCRPVINELASNTHLHVISGGKDGRCHFTCQRQLGSHL